MGYILESIKRIGEIFNLELGRDMKRKRIARRLYDLLDVSMPIDEMRVFIEAVHGRPARLAVPIWYNKEWVYDSRKICDPDREFRRATRTYL